MILLLNAAITIVGTYLFFFNTHTWNIRISHKFLLHYTRNNFNWLFLYEHADLSIILIVYGIDFSHPRTLLKYVSLETQSILKHFSTLFNMNSRKKHLRHIMLYCFKKDEICTVYGSNNITIIHNWFKKCKAGNFDLKDEGCSCHLTDEYEPY